MAGIKTVVQLEYNLNVQSLLKEIDKLMKRTQKPDLVYVKLSSTWFPKRVFDLPKELVEYVGRNPTVKFMWDDGNCLKNEDGFLFLDETNWKQQKFMRHLEKPNHVFLKIVIPNYNNKPYIRKCLDSILNQSFQDFHIIVVDDLSTDGSDKICEDYMYRFPQKVTLIRADKKGHEGGCRNIGMSYPNITSDYTYFVDGDDELYDNTVLDSIYEVAKDSFYDIILVGIVQKDFAGKLTFNKERIFDQTSKDMLLSQWNSASAKVVRTSFEVPFLQGCDHGADVYQFTMLLDKKPKIRQTDINAYLYKRNPNSLTMTKDNTRYKDDTFLFYRELLKLMYSCVNPDVRSAIEHRVSLWNNGQIKN